MYVNMTSMKIPNDYQAIEQAIGRLENILDQSSRYVDSGLSNIGTFLPDMIVSVGQHTFVIEWKRSGTLGQVGLAANQLIRAVQESDSPLIPLLVVPYMGVKGRSYCEQAKVSWLDLSGNSSITAEGLYVRERGHHNRYRRRGPLESPFGPKGSRIARWMLAHPGEVFRQRELASAVGLNEGYTSRVIRKLLENQLVTREREGIRLSDPDLLLSSWEEVYRFSRHARIPGHIPAQSGVELARSVAHTLNESSAKYAMTGLAAAWFQTRYAAFRLLTVYLSEVPTAEFKSRLAFRAEPRGANTLIVVPNDEGVFQANETLEEVRCVHPVQAYLDLQEHPERAKEAAEELYSRLLTWGRRDS